MAQGDGKSQFEKDLDAIGDGSPVSDASPSAGPTNRVPSYLSDKAQARVSVDRKASSDEFRSLVSSGVSQDRLIRNGQLQKNIDGALVNSTEVPLEQQRFNVGGGAMLTYGDLVNGYLADPNSAESSNLVSSLVSGRFLNPDDVADGGSVEAALSDAVRVRSATVAGLSVDTGSVIGDFWSTTAAYRGNAEDRFAGGGGGGAYKGPVSTVTEMNVEDLKNIANQTAGMLVGRAVSDDEFDKMLKKVRKAEKKDPRITDSSVDGKNSIQEGISDAGRQSIIRDALVNTDEADGVIKATTMMGNFDTWLRSKNG